MNAIETGLVPEIITFGKYRGKPVEVLSSDAEYRNWLVAQPWFRERHATIYNLVVNNFGEPSETPEHNAMCARFFDVDYRLAVLRVALRIVHRLAPYNQDVPRVSISARCDDPIFERGGWDVIYDGELRAMVNGEPIMIPEWLQVRVECKPAIGDDFPYVLRQLNTRDRPPIGREDQLHRVVLTDAYRGVGVGLEDVKRMFAASHIAFVASDDLGFTRG